MNWGLLLAFSMLIFAVAFSSLSVSVRALTIEDVINAILSIFNIAPTSTTQGAIIGSSTCNAQGGVCREICGTGESSVDLCSGGNPRLEIDPTYCCKKIVATTTTTTFPTTITTKITPTTTITPTVTTTTSLPCCPVCDPRLGPCPLYLYPCRSDCNVTTTTTTVLSGCTNHAQCSQACDSKCPIGVYGCCSGCNIGQCDTQTGKCYCSNSPTYCGSNPPYQVGQACGTTTTTTTITPTIPCSNLITNGNFETGTFYGWYSNTPNMEIVNKNTAPAYVYSGNFSANASTGSLQTINTPNFIPLGTCGGYPGKFAFAVYLKDTAIPSVQLVLYPFSVIGTSGTPIMYEIYNPNVAKCPSLLNRICIEKPQSNQWYYIERNVQQDLASLGLNIGPYQSAYVGLSALGSNVNSPLVYYDNVLLSGTNKPMQFYLCTYANPNNAGLGFYLNGKFYMNGQLAPIIPNVVYNLSAPLTVSNYRFSYWSTARTVNVTNINSANTNVIFGTSGWDGTCVGNLGANYQTVTCYLGTATTTSAVSYGAYRIYSDIGADKTWARIVIKDAFTNTVDTRTINQGDAYDSAVTGLTIRVFSVAALQDGTVVGTTILVHPRGTCC